MGIGGFTVLGVRSVLDLTFDETIDAGAFLTFLTIVTGFLAWSYKTVKEWRRDARREAESGALRLLLKILRERYEEDQGPIALSDLHAEFERPERMSERKAYCGREFRFKDDPDFEQAIYQLQWESKIDFAAGHRILFRTARPGDPPRPRLHMQFEPDLVLSAFKAAIADDRRSEFELERLGRLAVAANPIGTRDAMELAISSANGDTDRLVKILMVADALSE